VVARDITNDPSRPSGYGSDAPPQESEPYGYLEYGFARENPRRASA